MLEIFCKKFHRKGYIKFSKLDKYIRRVFKEIFITKKIYMNKLGDNVNQHLVNFVIDEQLPIWDKNHLHKYKKIYLILKI